MRVGCVGMASIDTSLFAGRARYDHDSVTLVDEVVVSLGGKGMVAAIAMRHAGVEVVPIALVGRDSQLTGLLPDGMRRDWLVPALEDDCRIWLSVSAAEHVAAWVSAGDPTTSDAELEEIAARYATEIDALYLSFEALPLLRAAIGAADRLALPIAANLSRPLIDLLLGEDPALLRAIVRRAAVLLCNAEEADAVLSGLSARSWQEVAGPDAEIVVTHGADGGTFSAAPFASWQRYEAVAATTVRSVVGAGDTFNGAFLAARWAHGLSPEESCSRAAALAALCVSVPTSSIPLDASPTLE